MRVPIYLLLLLVSFTWPAAAAESADRLVLISFDGLRPDAITEKSTPHLWALKQRGVFTPKAKTRRDNE
jgi:predicted AlkP superfamily pyrophosphatase or phosphodiesterase